MRHTTEAPDAVWLTAGEGGSEILVVASRADRDAVRLTRAQKWELMRTSAVAVLSAAFFLTPVLLPGRAPAISIPVDERPLPDRVGVLVTDLAVPISRVLESAPIAEVSMPRARAASRSRAVVAATAASESGTRPTLARKLGRAIFGDGRYLVRPFPTLDSTTR